MMMGECKLLGVEDNARRVGLASTEKNNRNVVYIIFRFNSQAGPN